MTERLNPKPENEASKPNEEGVTQEVGLRSAPVVKVGGMIVSSAKRRQLRGGERGQKETKFDRDLLDGGIRPDPYSVALRWSGGGVPTHSRVNRTS